MHRQSRDGTGATPTDTAWCLHTRVLAEDGTPRMTEAFTAVLAGRHPATYGAGTISTATLTAARARLAVEAPPLAAAVTARFIDRQTVRQVAATLGVSVRTAHVRSWAGLDTLAMWCHSDTATVRAVLGQDAILAIGKHT